MSHAADLRNAQFEACLVASEVIADQLAVPFAEEGSGMVRMRTKDGVDARSRKSADEERNIGAHRLVWRASAVQPNSTRT
ncbi:hypothetical protein EAH72_17395 [Pseudomonas caspiana]|nr:hypothetical protein EAH72_17395 [Pseudomonas caspiana]